MIKVNTDQQEQNLRYKLTGNVQKFSTYIKNLEAEEGAKLKRFQLILTGKQTQDGRNTKIARLTLSNGVFIPLFCGADFSVSDKEELMNCNVLEMVGGDTKLLKITHIINDSEEADFRFINHC